MLIFLPFTLHAQQLVKDPGFEALQYCPAGISGMGNAVFWYSPSLGTPDLFNKCAWPRSQVSVPKNICGKQKPFDGNGYGGMILYEYQYWDYKEYLQTELTTPLRKGATYRLAFNISLADNSMYVIDKIQAYFSKNMVFHRAHTTMSQVTPQITFEGPDKGYFTNKKDWVTLSYEYVAQGGERFLTLGNFIPDKYGKRKQVKKGTDVSSAYYFVDGVSVELIKPSDLPEEELEAEESEISETDTLTPGSTFSLRFILFETDKDVLLNESYIELDKVVRIMKKHPSIELEVRGHTDNQASDEHNQDLSERRALAVKKYLLSRGIEAFRLTTKGFGETRPVADNETEEGRALNRRVEFLVTKR